jgi:hypothetical protein
MCTVAGLSGWVGVHTRAGLVCTGCATRDTNPPVVVERRKDLLDRLESVVKSNDVEERLLLPGKARIRQVLSGRRRSDGKRHFGFWSRNERVVPAAVDVMMRAVTVWLAWVGCSVEVVLTSRKREKKENRKKGKKETEKRKQKEKKKGKKKGGS